MTNLFSKNKYTKWYFNIIENSKSKSRVKNKQTYFEKHHIIPKCIGGKETVLLTAKEHYICHLLLCKMTKGKLKRKQHNLEQNL